MRHFPFLCMIWFLISCGSSHKSNKTIDVVKISDLVEDCTMKATVESHPESSNLKCKWVLIMEEGERVLVANGTSLRGQYKDGDHIALAVEWLKIDDPFCHNATAHVNITCIRPFNINSASNNGSCINTIDVFSIPWMNEIMIKLKPTKVIKYNFDEDYAYHFIQRNKEEIYTCNGKLICSKTKNENECEDWMEAMSNPEVILVVNFKD